MQDLVEKYNQKFFVGVNEYDAPAKCLSFLKKSKNYHEISDHFRVRFFAIIRQSIGVSICKYWLTCVLPAFRDGFSPLTATQNISRSPQYNNARGFTGNEARAIAKAYLAATHDETELEKELEITKQRFSGHRFCPPQVAPDSPSLYNPQLVFTRLRTISRTAGHVHPDEVLNITHIASVLNAIKDDRDMNAHGLIQLLSANLRARIMTWFGVPELKRIGKSADITWTFLYYFGVITRGQGNVLLLPNLTMRHLVCVFLAASLPLPA